jgi:outer membrane protein TolC
VGAISDRPLIQRTAIVEAQAEFDIRAFIDSRFTRTSVPVGDTLTTGGPPRLREEDTFSTGGLRKKTHWGGKLELSQKFGLEDSNSLFFSPPNQGNARLSFSFTQPLLHGAGRPYNDSLTVLAQIDTRAAWASTAKELQNHLLQVARTHWELYREPPLRDYIPVEFPDALVTAMKSRPEMDEALQRVRAASVRLGVAENELLPVLDLVLESYVSGLQGDFDVNRAWEQQWNDGEPSYAAGVKFELPLRNRAAQARFQRRRLELRQLRQELAATSELLRTDVEIAMREVDTSYRQMVARYRAMAAAQANLDYLDRRWESLPGDDKSASFLLEDLLDAQDRLALEEFGFAQAQVSYTVSFYELKRAMGTLLRCQGIAPCEAHEDCLPRVLFQNRPPDSAP